ncbi:hypothetical protein BASA50_006081 [Batrachochytrium salamandrivorans]|uniref:Protein kinase domain-containing protein n=1 Tax=Batrachochytrium salamandrivorans TaxID=1357716 RepID=A0ABQ8FAU7_9FUNG|nr:hypothetical protein BASA62_010112 [Batrachochytrium salamandrivorans]KAH6595095.1 hypothetical protein BASA50_006081 [Batrachochytrium salamandrivorans]
MPRISQKANYNEPTTLSNITSPSFVSGSSSCMAIKDNIIKESSSPRTTGNLRSKGKFANSISSFTSLLKSSSKEFNTTHGAPKKEPKSEKERTWSSLIQDVLGKRSTLNETKLKKTWGSASTVSMTEVPESHQRPSGLNRFSSLRSSANVLNRPSGNVGSTGVFSGGSKLISRGWSFRSKPDVSVSYHTVPNKDDTFILPDMQVNSESGQDSAPSSPSTTRWQLSSPLQSSPPVRTSSSLPVRTSSLIFNSGNQIYPKEKRVSSSQDEGEGPVKAKQPNTSPELRRFGFKEMRLSNRVTSSSSISESSSPGSGSSELLKISISKCIQSIPRKPSGAAKFKNHPTPMPNALTRPVPSCTDSPHRSLISVPEAVAIGLPSFTSQPRIINTTPKQIRKTYTPAVKQQTELKNTALLSTAESAPPHVESRPQPVKDLVKPSKPPSTALYPAPHVGPVAICAPSLTSEAACLPTPASDIHATPHPQEEESEDVERNRRQCDLAFLVNGKKKLSDAFHSKYVLGDMLGDGAFGFVATAIRKSDNLEVAVKFIAKAKISRDLWVAFDRKHKELVPLEVALLYRMKHPNIIQYIDHMNEADYVLLITELHGTSWSAAPLQADQHKGDMNLSQPVRVKSVGLTNKYDVNGKSPMKPAAPTTTISFGKAGSIKKRTSFDLFECIDAHTRIPENVARKIFAQIAMAIEFLNSQGVVHRDLKDENIVIDSNYQIKLIDFGSASVIPQRVEHYFLKFNGTAHFASPEIASGNPYRGPEAEVWALGVLLFTIIFGENPFQNRAEIIKGAYSFTTNINSDLQNLLESMLCYDFRKRATINDVLNHRWLNSEVALIKAQYRTKSRVTSTMRSTD